MDLMKYYEILELSVKPYSIEVYGKNILNRYFYIKLEEILNDNDENNDYLLVDNRRHKITYFLEKSLYKNKLYNRSMMSRSRNSKWTIIKKDDLEFQHLYSRYMTLNQYVAIHAKIIRNL